MGKAIINKHIDNFENVYLTSLFDNDVEKRKGEIIICNDPNNPTIYIMDSEGNPKKIAGGGGSGSGSSYDDTAIRSLIAKNAEDIKELSESGLGSKTPNKIIVAGLSGQFGSGYYKNNDEIPAGTDVCEILQNILSQELYPSSVNGKEATASASMNGLSLSLSVSGTVEVGTMVELSECKTNGSFVSKTPSSISGMSYGYSKTNDDTKDSSNTTIIKECEAQISDNLYTISMTVAHGFDAGSQTLPLSSEGEGEASLEVVNIGCVAEGSNSVSVVASGASYTYHADKIDKVYYCSNIGKTDASKYHAGIEAVDGITEKATITTSANVWGAYYYFMGYSNNTSVEQFDSNTIRELIVKNGWVEKDKETVIIPNGTNILSNGKSIVIACPAHYKLKSINYSNQADMLPKFTSVGVVSVQTGEILSDYNVYVYPISNNTPVEFTNVSLEEA